VKRALEQQEGKRKELMNIFSVDGTSDEPLRDDQLAHLDQRQLYVTFDPTTIEEIRCGNTVFVGETSRNNKRIDGSYPVQGKVTVLEDKGYIVFHVGKFSLSDTRQGFDATIFSFTPTEIDRIEWIPKQKQQSAKLSTTTFISSVASHRSLRNLVGMHCVVSDQTKKIQLWQPGRRKNVWGSMSESVFVPGRLVLPIPGSVTQTVTYQTSKDIGFRIRYQGPESRIVSKFDQGVRSIMERKTGLLTWQVQKHGVSVSGFSTARAAAIMADVLIYYMKQGSSNSFDFNLRSIPSLQTIRSKEWQDVLSLPNVQKLLTVLQKPKTKSSVHGFEFALRVHFTNALDTIMTQMCNQRAECAKVMRILDHVPSDENISIGLQNEMVLWNKFNDVCCGESMCMERIVDPVAFYMKGGAVGNVLVVRCPSTITDRARYELAQADNMTTRIANSKQMPVFYRGKHISFKPHRVEIFTIFTKRGGVLPPTKKQKTDNIEDPVD
jgi:hypothetical protein